MSRALPWTIGLALVALPFVYYQPYPLHILIIILIWSFAYTSWSVMGRFGLVSLGHGGFMGVGAYFELWDTTRYDEREAAMLAGARPEALRQFVIR